LLTVSLQLRYHRAFAQQQTMLLRHAAEARLEASC
jgi:hypothetical protein